MIVVAHQHLLPSIIPFIDKVVSHLESPSCLFLLGKQYSTVPEVEKQLIRSGIHVIPTAEYEGRAGGYRAGINSLLSALWDDVEQCLAEALCKEVILIDEGGWLISSIPMHLKEYVVSCIEQTSSGIRNHPANVPVISVAESAAKRYFESPFIANAIVKKMQSQKWLGKGIRVGLIGHGFLGSALSSRLREMGFEVLAYDSNTSESMPDDCNLSQLISGSDLILGCAGKDVLDPDTDLAGVTGEKVFASCSSGDIEFNRLIQSLNLGDAGKGESFSCVEGYTNGGQLKVSIQNGGCPINFDRAIEWEDGGEIQLTRNLMLSALEQALSIVEAPGSIMLDPERQMEITREWFRTSKSECRLDAIHSKQGWWVGHSGGRLPASYSVESRDMTKQYQTHWTTPGFVQMMREHQEPYTFKLQGQEVVVHPGVFSPYYDWSSELVIENLPDLTGKTVLEVGCGSGVISLFCYLKGAKFVTAVDINPAAIRNTKDNLKRNGAVNFKCFESDVFSNASGKFDLIIFNAPYHGNEPADILEYAVSDPKYRALTLFLGGVKSHLADKGEVLLGFSESGDVDLMSHLIKENALHVEWMRDGFRKEYNAQVYMLWPS